MLTEAQLLLLGFAVTYAAAALETGFGMVLFLARPRTGHSMALGTFMLINGAIKWYIPYHEAHLEAPAALYFSIATMTLGVIAYGALGFLGVTYPTRLRLFARPRIPWFAWLPLLLLPSQLLAVAWNGTPADPSRLDIVNTLRTMSGHLARAPLWFFVLVILGRLHRRGTIRGGLDIMAGGWLLYLGAFTGMSLGRMARGQVGLTGLDDPPYYAYFVLAATVLVMAMARHPSIARRVRAMLTAYLAMALAGITAVVVLPADAEVAVRLLVLIGGVAAATIVTGYAVLRHQLLDIRLSIKIGVRRSTVAATVLAAGFVVSELASALLSERLGPVLGILTAGLLIFAAAPLHQWGQRVADKAMPTVKPLSERSDAERADMYRRLAESAWADGTLSRSESRVLQTAREQLALTAAQAAAIESQVRG